MSPLPVLPPTWDELRDLAPHDAWAEAVRSILRKHGMPAEDPRMFDSGSDVVMRAGEVVVKLTAPKWRAELIAEAENLGRVAGHLPVQTPRVLGQGELHGWPYVITSFVPGVPLGEIWSGLGAGARVALVAELGQLLGALHRIRGASADERLWRRFLYEMRSGVVVRHASRVISRRYPDHPANAWLDRIEPFLDAHPLSERPLAWLHTEVLGDHVFVEQRGGAWHLSAMIDFADGRAGHPFYEMPAPVEFLFHGQRPLLRELLLSYGLAPTELGPALSRELLCWSLLHRFSSLPRMLAAAGVPTPGGFEEMAERLYGVET